MTKTDHPFERAGLGCAPFVYVGHERKVFQAIPGDPDCPLQPGGSCDFCGTGIMDFFWVKSADGKRFKVGSDCAAKISKKYGSRELGDIRRAANELRREAKASRDQAKIDQLREWLADESVRAALESQPHPLGFQDRATGRPLSRLDAAEWTMQHAGVAGRLRLWKVVRAMREVAS